MNSVLPPNFKESEQKPSQKCVLFLVWPRWASSYSKFKHNYRAPLPGSWSLRFSREGVRAFLLPTLVVLYLECVHHRRHIDLIPIRINIWGDRIFSARIIVNCGRLDCSEAKLHFCGRIRYRSDRNDVLMKIEWDAIHNLAVRSYRFGLCPGGSVSLARYAGTFFLRWRFSAVNAISRLHFR